MARDVGDEVIAWRGGAAVIVAAGRVEPRASPVPPFARALEGADVSLVVHDETTLIAPDDLPFSLDDLPDVFSTYRRQVECSCRVP
ncbi:MAG: hypothetical protein FJW29_03240 [Acidobacteria bacterium]|nr:hypothetical protein [Acidobacteriota bacterium]